MSDARAIKATFSTWRPVQGRKVLQLIFEIPIEQQGEVLTMLGAPDDKWCAIAVLNMKPVASEGASPARETALHADPKPDKPKKAFSDYPLSAQCAMTCEDGDFIRYLTEMCPNAMKGDGYSAAIFVRSYCGVTSRRELSTNPAAAVKWHKLNAEFELWKTDQRYPAGGRR